MARVRYHSAIRMLYSTAQARDFWPDKTRPARRRLHAAITDEGAASGDGGPTRTVGLWSRMFSEQTLKHGKIASQKRGIGAIYQGHRPTVPGDRTARFKPPRTK